MLLDLIFGAIILILIGFGIYKGLTGMFFGTFSIILSLLIAFFLADVVGNQIFNSPLGTALTDFLNGKLAALGDLATAPIIQSGGQYVLDTTEGEVALSEAMKAFGPLAGVLTSYAEKILPTLEVDGMSLADKFVPVIAKIILSAASGVVLFILAEIILKIFGKISKSWEENPVFNKINRVLGFLLMTFIGVLVVNFLMLAAAEAPHIGFFNALKEMQSTTFVSKYFYEHNWLKSALDAMGVNADEIFNRYFPAPA